MAFQDLQSMAARVRANLGKNTGGRKTRADGMLVLFYAGMLLRSTSIAIVLGIFIMQIATTGMVV